MTEFHTKITYQSRRRVSPICLDLGCLRRKIFKHCTKMADFKEVDISFKKSINNRLFKKGHAFLNLLAGCLVIMYVFITSFA
jgi:hypothetical protein